jgi:hypothetical protein
MSIGRVVRHFEGIGKVPIDLKDVVALVRQLVPGETIRVRGVNVDPARLMGTCYRYAIDDSKILVPRQVSYVVYNNRLDPYLQRLVCCKELVHVLDPDPILTTTKEKVVNLLERVLKNVQVNHAIPNKDANVFAALFDQLAKWHAMAILFPFGLWEELEPRLDEISLDDKEIAKIADWVELPIDHVGAVLIPDWRAVRENLLAFT